MKNESFDVVVRLYNRLQSKDGDSNGVVRLLGRLMDTGEWRDFTDEFGRRYQYDTLREFIEARFPAGLQTTPAHIYGHLATMGEQHDGTLDDLARLVETFDAEGFDVVAAFNAVCAKALAKIGRGEPLTAEEDTARRAMSKAVDAVGETAALPADQTAAPRNPHGRKGRPEEEGEESGPVRSRLNKQVRGDHADMRRLNRDRPDLAQRVRDREMSLNAAAVEAGIRPRTIKIADTDPARVAKRIRASFGKTFARDLAYSLLESAE